MSAKIGGLPFRFRLLLAPVLAIGGSWMVASKLLEARQWDAVTRLTAEAIGMAAAA